NTSPPPPRAPRTAEKLASPCADRVAGAHGEIRTQLVAAEPTDLAVLPGSRFVAWPDKSCPRYAGERRRARRAERFWRRPLHGPRGWRAAREFQGSPPCRRGLSGSLLPDA